MHGMDLWKWLFHLGSPFICSLIPLANFHTLRWKELRPTLPSPCSWQRPWDGDRSGQQRSALSVPGSGSQPRSESGLMGQPPALLLLQATSTGSMEHMLLCLNWTIARQAPLSTGFSGKNLWSGLPFPLPGDLANPAIQSKSLAALALAGTAPPGKPFLDWCPAPNLPSISRVLVPNPLESILCPRPVGWG